MTRCPWCGARNYAIDMWCERCGHYLDWAPPGSRRRRIVGFLSAVAALVGVSLFLALAVAAWIGGSRPTVWIGTWTWQGVDTTAGWLLNQPDLQPGT